MGLQLASPLAVQSWAARELPLCDGRKSQCEQGTKAVYSDPRHDSYIPLRPPKAQSNMHCIFKTVLVLLCENLTRRWGLGPHLEGANQSGIFGPLGINPSAGSSQKLFNFFFVKLGCPAAKCESWEPGESRHLRGCGTSGMGDTWPGVHLGGPHSTDKPTTMQKVRTNKHINI